MPCPYFEPQGLLADGRHIGGRLPLLDEYEGWCHVSGTAQAVLPFVRFAGCNHGRPDSGCTLLPAGENRRNRRFTVQRKSEEAGSTLEILILDIQDHTPVRSQSVRYSELDESLEPNLTDRCARAQALAFCRSYLRRFPHSINH